MVRERGRDEEQVAFAVGEVFDRVAEELFRTPFGKEIAADGLRRFEAEVGRLSEGDENFELLHANRSDWMLCEMELASVGDGDSLAYRAYRGDVPEVEAARDDIRTVLESFVGLFEASVSPETGTCTWVHDCLSGLSFRLSHPLQLSWENKAVLGTNEELRPNSKSDDVRRSLWEGRVREASDGVGVEFCRPPLEYPAEAWDAFRKIGWRPVNSQADRRMQVLQSFRRARLRWTRGQGRFSFVV